MSLISKLFSGPTPTKQSLMEISAFLGALAEDLAECTEAALGTVDALEQISAGQQELRMMLVDIASEQQRQAGQINRYIADAARAEGSLAQLRSEVREIRRG